jgi:tRNA-modifying protein YgfZ
MWLSITDGSDTEKVTTDVTAHESPNRVDGYDRARNDVVLEAPADRGVVALVGPDAVSFLHAILTNDVNALAPGTACYSAYLTPQGRMICDMHVLRADGEVVLDVEPFVAASVAQRLDASIFAEQVRVEDRSAGIRGVTVHGPRARTAVVEALRLRGDPAERIESLSHLQHVTLSLASGSLTVLMGDWLGVPALRIVGAPTAVADITDRLQAAGIPVLPHHAQEALRIESGTPLFGVDMTTETIPLEAGLEARAISMTKGCYIGQEVIIRILHRGHGRIARRLVQLRVESEEPPAAGTPVHAGREQVGVITSAEWSPHVAATVALGYVRREVADSPRELRVGGPDGALATVTVLSHESNGAT